MPEPAIDLYLIRIEKELESVVSELASKLRRQNLTVEFDYILRSVKAQMREANKLNARFALFIGGEEYEQGSINLKNMENGEQKIIPLNSPEEIIKQIKT